MIQIGIEIKYQTCNLCDALHRNITDDFDSVSFEFLGGGNIQVKFILKNMSDEVQEYIDDIMAEFSALQDTDCVNKPIVEIGVKNLPLKNLVYQNKVHD